MKKKDCQLCGCEKTWNGSDMECPFQDPKDRFDNNWNCGALARFRAMLDKAWFGNPVPDYVDYRFMEDQHVAIIDVSGIDDLVGGLDDDLGTWYLSLWITWYKRRGATDNCYLLPEKGEAVKPTFEQLMKIADYYGL